MNEHHQRHIATTLRHIDGVFAEIEGILAALGSGSPLSPYAPDVEPMQRGVVEDHLHRIREEMVEAMKRLGIPLDGRRTSACWSIRNHLLGASIAIAEMEPSHLRGYGALDAGDKTEITRVCADMERLIRRVDSYLARVHGGDPGQRIARLEGAPVDCETLAALERIISRRHLLELRPALDAILDRLESRQFEIAFFGRVSSGKSSLLNHILGESVLPVGVTPVTAVPTRLRRGERPEMVVYFELSSPARLPAEQIADFVTEEGNPGNRRRVKCVEVTVSSARCSEGIVFVDTPGVGSLATAGAAQTLAYLPRCDLGVLLLDAGTTLHQEDLRILQGFEEAAIPAMVLLSKCDLLRVDDRQRMIQYVERQVREALGLSVVVAPVSTVGRDARLARRWFDEHVRPIMRQHRELASASIRRKVGALQETLAATLSSMMSRNNGRLAPVAREDAEAAGRMLEETAARIARFTEQASASDVLRTSDDAARLIEDAAAQMPPGRGGGQAARAGLRDVLLSRLATEASSCRDGLVGLQADLTNALIQLGDRFGLVGGPETRRLEVSLTPLPPASEKNLAAIPDVRPSKWLASWRWLARRRLRAALRRHCRWPIETALGDHRRALRAWVKTNLNRLVEAYETQAGVYREALRRAADSSADDGRDRDPSLEEDLETLRRLAGRPGGPQGPSPAGESSALAPAV
ncbi:MAG: dynamin family protein [Phycisphaerae bacterium]